MPTQWTNADFESMSWHDCHIHGLHIGEINEDWGACELELDIDYIMEWILESDRSFKFRLAPATLTFHRASGLRMMLDYTGAGMTPFEISGIEREPHIFQGQVTTYHWRLPISWPMGESRAITFDAPGFTQTLRRDPILHHAQCFTTAERAGC
ncbi:MAG TPA: hypothetical protein VHQ47_13205 [Phycisphaerae bacterium]|jgi:hypothetical protein|nr:hypothetical protein [Phycisphaerae bacterium]